MYGRPSYNDVNQLRCDVFKEKFKPSSGLRTADGSDLSLLPPCRTSLRLHIARANYQCYIWQHAAENFPEIPTPESNGWKIVENAIHYVWNDGAIFPPSFLDESHINAETDETDEEDLDNVELNDFIDYIYGQDENDSTDDEVDEDYFP